LKPSLTVAICTRHRPRDLLTCVASLARAERPEDVDVLIIDDGDAPLDDSELRALAIGHGYGFRCIHNPGPHGLVHGRVLAIKASRGEVVLFLDDDVEIEPHYLVRLVLAYERHPDAAGVGGLDTLTHGKGALARLYRRLFLLESGHPGRLSASGFNGSMEYWQKADRPFETEFLSGCNMSFRKSAIGAFTPAPWLEGYSHGEDMVLSQAARATGKPLIADPSLQVEHHRSPESRVPSVKTAYTTIRNTYFLLELRRARWWAYPALFWTTLGLVAKDTVKPGRMRLVPSYLRALRDVSRDLWARARSR
jgi:GT2 family glycosyltransferase